MLNVQLNKKLATTALAMTMAIGMPMTVAMNTAQAAATSEATAAKNLNALLGGVKSMSANFTQSTTGGKANRTFSGSMQVQRPNKFRWQVNGAASQLIVANGNTLWIYDKDLNQVTRQNVSNQVGDTPALLLSGDPSKIANNFKVTQPIAGKNYYVLYPKNANGTFKSLGIAFNRGNPVMMVLNDNLGQTTSIKFNGVKRNGNIPASQFTFTPPKGADVISQ